LTFSEGGQVEGFFRIAPSEFYSLNLCDEKPFSIGAVQQETVSKMGTKVVKVRSNSGRACADKGALWNGSRLPEDADFFTIGYQGRKTDELLTALRDAGVKRLVDIRYNPVSRFRPEMSKSNLRRLIESAGLGYLHVREWGRPS
jgi:hypothetical protein